MKYRANLEMDAGDVRVSGGQGDWIVIHGEGPDGKLSEVAVPRKSLEKLARLLIAMKYYLSEDA